MALNPNPSQLDFAQVLKRSFDGDEDRLRVDAEITAVVAGPTEVVITHTDDSIRLGDGTDFLSSTTVGSDVGLDVNIIGGSVTGEFTQTGLFVAGKNTTMNVTDVATALPTTPLSGRNSMAITNLSTSDTLYIGFSTSVTADRALGNNAGWEIGVSEGFNIDIQDNIIIYAIAETGKTIKIKVMELA